MLLFLVFSVASEVKTPVIPAFLSLKRPILYIYIILTGPLPNPFPDCLPLPYPPPLPAPLPDCLPHPLPAPLPDPLPDPDPAPLSAPHPHPFPGPLL